MRYKLQLRLGAVGNSEQVSGGEKGKETVLFLEGRQNLPSSNLSGLRVQNPRSWKISRVMDFPIHLWTYAHCNYKLLIYFDVRAFACDSPLAGSLGWELVLHLF